MLKINSPKDLKKLTNLELEELCREIRDKIKFTVSKNGGHLASSLGAVELTVALHKEFNMPDDKIIWDRGHQGYAHKLLTGRFKEFDSLRKKGGVSAFINPSESEYDTFIAGHASNALSAACGVARAELLKKTNNLVLAVIGDGALTGGLAYEGLNNAHDLSNLIIILNCNDMSISRTVGCFYKYISTNMFIENFLNKIPVLGKFFNNISDAAKEKIKTVIK